MRAILHSDMNSYYASVETMLDPSLRGKAVAVCGSTETRHGIVLAKSELAKKSGVKTGMANWEAKKCCPDLIMVPPHYEQYMKYSALAHEIYNRYTDLIEPFGIDECWLDVTGSSCIGEPLFIAEEIRKKIKEELGLTVSIGVSFTKVFAKLGSDMKKPDATTCIAVDSFKDKVWPLPASDLFGVGRATSEKLWRRGVKTIGDIAKSDRTCLKSWFGKNGLKLWEYANGIDESRVAPFGYVPAAKSVGRGITCYADLTDRQEVKNVLLALAPKVSRQLRELHSLAGGIALAIRDNQLFSREYQTKLRFPTQSWREMVDSAMVLLDQRYTWQHRIRSVTIRAIDLVSEKIPFQMDLFGDYAGRERTERLERAIDDINLRFGEGSVQVASAMNAKIKRDYAREQLSMPGIFSV